MAKIELFSIVLNVGLLFLVLYLVWMKKLRLQYALLWLLTFVVMVLFTCFPYILDRVAPLVGIYYSPTLLFLVAFLFLLVIMLHYSVVISTLFENNKTLVQKFCVMRNSLENMKKILEERGGGR